MISVLERWQLSTIVPPFAPAAVWAAMATDKKRQGNTMRFILPRTIGDVDIFDNITETEIQAVLS
jgi:3-dehydroquinate synthetase